MGVEEMMEFSSKLPWQLLWRKRFLSFKNLIKNATFPVPVYSLGVLMTIITAIHFADQSASNVIAITQSLHLFTYPLANCLLASLLMWLTWVFAVQWSVRLLLLYKGWIYEDHGYKKSLATRVWAATLKALLMWQKPQLYSFQGLLPRLPVPSLDVTIEKYLRSMRPLLDDQEYNRLLLLSGDFQRNVGPKLQRYLQLKSWSSTNYVSDWWKKYVYLSCRSPLMINSNVYAVDLIFVEPTNIQSARAAYLTYAYLHCRELISSQQLQPIVFQGIIPLCSLQYAPFYNTTRVPGFEVDEILHFGDEFNHIVAYHKGKYFQFPIYRGNRLLRPCELELLIQWILNDNSSPPCDGELKLASLTAGNRTDWAKARHEFFTSGLNKESLRIIETAAFVLILDDILYEYDKDDPEKLDKFCAQGLHGKGHNRWFDKSFNLCVSANGKAIIHAEHSWADGAVTASISEYVLSMELIEKPYKEDGHTKGQPDPTMPQVTRLRWDFNRQCLEAIEKSALLAEEMIANVDLHAHLHYDYGKGFMKRVKVSPDAYVQMALQLAYYRDTGKLAMTYEASITRLYRAGRTETIRPCTLEMAAWVNAMEDPNVTVEEKRELLMATAARHRINSQDAMCGQGVDRHLFALYVVSKYLQVDSPFLKEVFNKPWKLSTSQIPLQQYFMVDLRKEPRFIAGGAGFGPVHDDGYGVCYAFGGEDLLIFHISSKHTSPETNSTRFAEKIKGALTDMRTIMVLQKS